jgi:hypothetical protein
VTPENDCDRPCGRQDRGGVRNAGVVAFEQANSCVALGSAGVWALSLLRDESQGRGCGVVCHHPLDRRAAVASVLGAVGGIDIRAQPGLTCAEVLSGDIDLQARYADPCSPRVQHVTEPAVVTPVPGPHVGLPADVHNPDRHLAPQRPAGAPDGDPQFIGAADSLQLVRRPGSHEAIPVRGLRRQSRWRGGQLIRARAGSHHPWLRR